MKVFLKESSSFLELCLKHHKQATRRIYYTTCYCFYHSHRHNETCNIILINALCPSSVFPAFHWWLQEQFVHRNCLLILTTSAQLISTPTLQSWGSSHSHAEGVQRARTKRGQRSWYLRSFQTSMFILFMKLKSLLSFFLSLNLNFSCLICRPIGWYLTILPFGGILQCYLCSCPNENIVIQSHFLVVWKAL
jgi:hypothetical protein